MYYIEQDIEFVDQYKKIKLGFHTITQLWFDYTNTELIAHVASWKNKDKYKEGIPSSNLFMFKYDYDKHNYNVDPNLFALRLLVQQEDGLFYKAEIKKVYDMSGDW